ncbi:hypothetical protein K4F52_001483 [Lecanicillium sp. MT-2017a]|nr:hypothetical protein K4F52_001483 [Lecanicillium sp. MT-2017a]
MGIMRRQPEPFVQPGYAELNPAYEQPQNTKPVWSLAKPLPRVVRPGMVPTKEELVENLQREQLPVENLQRQGQGANVDVERGTIDVNASPLEDARLQREENFMVRILAEEGMPNRAPYLAKTLSAREPPSFVRPALEEQLSAAVEGEVVPGPISDAELPRSDDGHGSGGADMLTDPDDLHALVQELVEKEVHNNHTAWSVIRTRHREPLAESLGVFIQVTIGICSNLAVKFGSTPNPNTSAWAWGFATMMGIYVSGGVSGAHINPIITIILWFYRGFPSRMIGHYLAAQLMGAFCGSLVAYGIYYDSIHEYLGSHEEVEIVATFVTGHHPSFIKGVTAFFNDFLAAMFFAITIFAFGDDQNAPPGSGMNSFIIGLVLTCLTMALSQQTGTSFNPTRDLGARLAMLAFGYSDKLFTDAYWFYGPWAGSISGAMFGGLLYDVMIFTGGESPINYPLERTSRAMRKGGQKWKRRCQQLGSGALFSRRKKAPAYEYSS